jgi:hypothetical protein
MVKDNFETGDLILVSSNENYSNNRPYIPYLNHDYLNRIIGGGNEWNHVALFVKINGEPYVYDTCPYYPKWIPYDFTLNEYKESGFISLPKYVDYLNGYLGIRKLKKSYTPQDRSIFLDIIRTHNKNMRFSLDYIKIFQKPHIKSLAYKYSCCEAVASIYYDAGIQHQMLSAGTTLKPYSENQSPLFGHIVHIKPGPKINDSLNKYFSP